MKNITKTMALLSFILGFIMQVSAVTPELFVPDANSPYYRIKNTFGNNLTSSVNDGNSADQFFAVPAAKGVANINQWWYIPEEPLGGTSVIVDEATVTSAYYMISIVNGLTINLKGQLSTTPNNRGYDVVRFWKDTETGNYAIRLVGTGITKDYLFNIPTVTGNIKFFTNNSAEPPTQNYGFVFEKINLKTELTNAISYAEVIENYDCAITSLKTDLNTALSNAKGLLTVSAADTVTTIVTLAKATEAVKNDRIFKIHDSSLTVSVVDWTYAGGKGVSDNRAQAIPNLGGTMNPDKGTNVSFTVGRVDFSTIGTKLDGAYITGCKGNNVNISPITLYVDDTSIGDVSIEQTDNNTWNTWKSMHLSDAGKTALKSQTGIHQVYLKCETGTVQVNIASLTFTVDDTATGLENVTAKSLVYSENGKINATFDGIAKVGIYSITGQLIEQTAANGSFSQQVAPGVYVVRINGKAYKVIAK